MNSENLVGKIVTLKILEKKYFQDYMSMFSDTVKKFLHVKHDESEVKYLETRLEKIAQNKSFFYCIFLNERGKSGDFLENNSGGVPEDKSGDVPAGKLPGPDKLAEKLIGAIEIRHLSESDGQLYSWVNENYWGSGAYQEALSLISKKYFEMCGVGTGAGSAEICDTGTCGAGVCATRVGCDETCTSRTLTSVTRKYYTANVDAENLRSYYALKKFGFIDVGVKNGPYGLQYRLVLVGR